MSNAELFFSYATAREDIRRQRERGVPPPWTNDEVLANFRFCNVFREDDKTTVWFRENWRGKVRDEPIDAVWGCFLFRWFCRIETGQRLLDAGLMRFRDWDPDVCRKALTGVAPIVTGAYMIKTPAGLNKLEGLLSVICQTHYDTSVIDTVASGDWTLEQAHTLLMSAPLLGPFMAYEVVTDLRHTCVLENAADINTWASPGPGAARGLDWVYGPPEGHRKRTYTNEASRAQMMCEMQTLLQMSRDRYYWPWDRPWEMREVEHTLCEFDKFMRGHSGQRLKRHFRQ